MAKNYKILGIVCIIAVIAVAVFYFGGTVLSGKTAEALPSPGTNEDGNQPIDSEQNLELEEPEIPEVTEPEDNRPTEKKAVKVKGIYMTGVVFNYPKFYNQLVDLVERTELNALVIDVKDDSGFLSGPLPVPLAEEIGTPYHKGCLLYTSRCV